MVGVHPFLVQGRLLVLQPLPLVVRIRMRTQVLQVLRLVLGWLRSLEVRHLQLISRVMATNCSIAYLRPFFVLHDHCACSQLQCALVRAPCRASLCPADCVRRLHEASVLGQSSCYPRLLTPRQVRRWEILSSFFAFLPQD